MKLWHHTLASFPRIFEKNIFKKCRGQDEYATNPKKCTLLKTAHRVQFVVKWAHGVPKIGTPYGLILYTIIRCAHSGTSQYSLVCFPYLDYNNYYPPPIKFPLD